MVEPDSQLLTYNTDNNAELGSLVAPPAYSESAVNVVSTLTLARLVRLRLTQLVILLLSLTLFVYFASCTFWGVIYSSEHCEFALSNWMIFFGIAGSLTILCLNSCIYSYVKVVMAEDSNRSSQLSGEISILKYQLNVLIVLLVYFFGCFMTGVVCLVLLADIPAEVCALVLVDIAFRYVISSILLVVILVPILLIWLVSFCLQRRYYC